jgi:signal transduction histidine kinase/ActR/RegA family two-component response regulator
VDRKHFFKPFLFLVLAGGAGAMLFSLYRFSLQPVNWHFLFVAAAAVVVSRLSISIPNVKGEVTVSDTLVFLTMMLYGGDAAILVAVVDGLSSSLHVSRKARVWLFNSAQMALSTFVTVWTMRTFFGPLRELNRGEYSATLIGAICVMILVQYVCNSGLVATYTALKTDQPVFGTWRKYYLWTSISYVVGAPVASIAMHMADGLSVYTLLMIAPIVGIIFLTYKTYLKNVAASAETAEAAKRHANELSVYIEEQNRIREQFSQIEKMSALGELASGVAHDFNNTLAGILGRAELMLRKATDEEVRRGLNIIIQAAQDGSKTVKRIQDFARQRRDHDFFPVAVDQLLMDISEVTRPRWKDRPEAANVHIGLDLQIHSNASVMGDDAELREVLVNMVFNAVDAMPTGGRLTLSANECDGWVEIAVSDTGEGISPEVRSRIFDPFFTTKGKAGMGLGLAVCDGMVQRHQGSIEIESEVGQGTTFRIKLPIAKVKPQKVKPSEPEIASVPRLSLVRSCNSPKVLVVDDEPAVRELLGEILNSEGYEVTLAENGSTALAAFERNVFKAVFTDIGMPGMSGWELARAIRERDQEIPISVITGWGEAVGSDEQKKAKVDWVLAKPFSLERIGEILLEISRRSGLEIAASRIAAVGT